MKTVSIRDAKNRLTELAREVERGETVVVTRNGRPAFDLVPHQARKGLRLEAIDEFKRKHRIKASIRSYGGGSGTMGDTTAQRWRPCSDTSI